MRRSSSHATTYQSRTKYFKEGREEGRESALLEGLANLMASTGCTAERASEMLGLPAEERQRYLEKLKGIPPK